MVNFIELFRLLDQGRNTHFFSTFRSGEGVRVEGLVTAGAKIYGTCLRSDTSKVVEKMRIFFFWERGDQGEESKRSILL